ncbi:MAG: phosphatase PAP2 family protein, partial [Crinalium sp.]
MRQLFQQMISAMPLWMRSLFKRATSWQLLPLLLTIRIGGLVLAGLAMWGFAEIAEQVLEKESRSFDTAILLLLKSWHTPLLDRVMLSFTFIGEPSSLLVVSLVIGIWLLIERRYKEATTIVIAAAGSGALNYWLKELFARSRPELWQRVIDVQHYSFPSGHAMVSMVVYGIIGYLLSTHFPRWSGLIIS